jgi:hypothetical protein
MMAMSYVLGKLHDGPRFYRPIASSIRASESNGSEQPSSLREEPEKDEWTTRQIITVLQFFVGGLVTFGGIEFARNGVYPLGTALGLIHFSVGVTGLFAGYAFFRRKAWSRVFLLGINMVTIGYSTFSESVAQIESLLPGVLTASLIGTIIAIVVSCTIIYLLVSKRSD